MNQDWRVYCNGCGTTYTPKARTSPTSCYNCESGNIDAWPINNRRSDNAPESDGGRP